MKKSKRSLSELVNVIAWYTECELVCKLAKLFALRRDSVSRLSRGCVTERNWLPSNMSHVFARVRDVLIEFTVNTNLPFGTAKSFQLLEIWTNPTIREAAFRILAQTHHDSRHWPRLCTGSVSRDSNQRLTTAVVRGCNHFQFLLRSHQQIVLSNSRLPPWKYKRLQTTLRPSEPKSRPSPKSQPNARCWM